MAVPTDTIWEVQLGGSDANGGAFSAANAGATGTDHSQSAATSFTVTTNGTTTVVATSGSFDNTMLGNCINIATDNVYIIVGFTDATHVTVHAATANGGAGLAAKVGGPMATPGYVGGKHAAGNIIWIKYNASVYSIASTTSNVATGRFQLATAAVANPTVMRGYDVTRGDETANRPTLQWGVNGSTFNLVSMSAVSMLENIIIDGNRANFTGKGITLAGASFFRRVLLKNCTTSPCDFFNASVWIDCEWTNNAAIGGTIATTTSIIRCNFHDNPAAVLKVASNAFLFVLDCIFDTNTGTGLDVGASTLNLHNTVFYNHTGTNPGLNFNTQPNQTVVTNCIFEGNTNYGVNFAAAYKDVTFLNNAYYNNTTGTYPASSLLSYRNLGEITLSGSAFVDAPNADFRLNNTASAGRLLRGAGFPQTFAGGTTSSRPDIGASQHADPASGPVFSSGMGGGVD